jgi:hypothetical protein
VTSATSDALGNANFVLDEGGIEWDEVAGVTTVTLPNLDFTVTAQGPGGGGPVTLQSCTDGLKAARSLKMISFDMYGGDILVGLQDLGDFATVYNTVAPRADYDWSGGNVALGDLGAFATHYNHQ